GHVGDDAVVISRIALRDGERLAPSLRSADVVVEARPLAVNALDDDHRGIAGLFHLHEAEVLDGLVMQRPVVGAGWRRGHATGKAGRRTAGGCTGSTGTTGRAARTRRSRAGAAGWSARAWCTSAAGAAWRATRSRCAATWRATEAEAGLVTGVAAIGGK